MSFIEHDVSRSLQVDGPIDYVLHLASPASPVDFERIPIKIIKVGTLGTHNMLGLALRKQARLLLASTSEVYGDPLVHPQPETYFGNVNPVGIRGVYDESKRAAEAYVMAYHRQHGVDTRIVRIFNTYGPGMRADDGRAIPNFATQALRGEPLTVYGDGLQTRDFTYVTDVVQALTRAAEAPNVSGQVYNVGTGRGVTLLELAEALNRLLGTHVTPRHGPPRVGDVRHSRADISRIRRDLGYEPRVAFEEGLAETVRWFQSSRSPSGRG